MRKICTLFFATMTCFSCTRYDCEKYTTLSYKQTYCADPWTNVFTDDSLTLKNVAHFLDSNQLYIAGLSIKQENSPEACSSCSCKTGKTISVSTFDDDFMKSKYLKLGFK